LSLLLQDEPIRPSARNAATERNLLVFITVRYLYN
jgi:hypothetical protein